MRTAALAATATAMGTAMWRRHAVRHGDTPASPPPAEPPPSGITEDQLNRLERLAELRKAEVLSQGEFEAQKTEILGSAP